MGQATGLGSQNEVLQSKYWGDVHKYTPQCKTRTFVYENTITRGWDDVSLQSAYCNAAASKGGERNMQIVDVPGRGPTPADYIPRPLLGLPAAAIEDTIVFTHSMANNILSGALASGVCSFGKGGTWYSIAGPLDGAKAVIPGAQVCDSRRTKAIMAYMTPLAPLKALCDGSKLQQTWKSLDPGYDEVKKKAAYGAMQAQDALKATVCGDNEEGMRMDKAWAMRQMATFWTRGLDPSSVSDAMKATGSRTFGNYGNDPLKDVPSDGAVSLRSCKYGARPGWTGHSGHEDAGLWVTPQNHDDLTCRNGDWMRACSWFGLAE